MNDKSDFALIFASFSLLIGTIFLFIGLRIAGHGFDWHSGFITAAFFGIIPFIIFKSILIGVIIYILSVLYLLNFEVGLGWFSGIGLSVISIGNIGIICASMLWTPEEEPHRRVENKKSRHSECPYCGASISSRHSSCPMCDHILSVESYPDNVEDSSEFFTEEDLDEDWDGEDSEYDDYDEPPELSYEEHSAELANKVKKATVIACPGCGYTNSQGPDECEQCGRHLI